MTHKLEVFFDYACPFCLKGHEYLNELLPQYPQLEVEWHPCEAHPRPGRYGLHSDLLARGMYAAQEQGADLSEYHRRAFAAALTEGVNIEDLSAVTARMDGLLDRGQFYKTLLGGAYEKQLAENNHTAWSDCAFDAVPSYRMDGNLLPCTPGVGITPEQLTTFITQHGLTPAAR